ncbi:MULTISPECIES: hypothetical protein [Paenibacillus]|uniref:LysM domain-containing protein n=2 Tax=Paenibacillus TaxID=44249 RepID=A0A1R1F3G3_9BACL|nr:MULTISPECIES: hypothetical protein [Paenibacillus]OMF58607.1 hypothetical protein BK138_08865 [Paenibacillus rhizosphaerae]GIO53049.1 hypothetical protein J21TS7_13670 [Paenibacillus cineris]
MNPIKNALLAGTLACIVFAGSHGIAFADPAPVTPQTDDSPSAHIATPDQDRKENGHHIRHGHHGRKYILLKDAADLLGMSVQDLSKEWKQGKTLQQIAKEKKGWSGDELVKRMTAVQSSKIDAAVKAGKMTQERADQLKQKLPASLKRFTERTYRPHSDRTQPGSYSHI